MTLVAAPTCLQTPVPVYSSSTKVAQTHKRGIATVPPRRSATGGTAGFTKRTMVVCACTDEGSPTWLSAATTGSTLPGAVENTGAKLTAMEVSTVTGRPVMSTTNWQQWYGLQCHAWLPHQGYCNGPARAWQADYVCFHRYSVRDADTISTSGWCLGRPYLLADGVQADIVSLWSLSAEQVDHK